MSPRACCWRGTRVLLWAHFLFCFFYLNYKSADIDTSNENGACRKNECAAWIEIDGNMIVYGQLTLQQREQWLLLKYLLFFILHVCVVSHSKIYILYYSQVHLSIGLESWLWVSREISHRRSEIERWDKLFCLFFKIIFIWNGCEIGPTRIK